MGSISSSVNLRKIKDNSENILPLFSIKEIDTFSGNLI